MDIFVKNGKYNGTLFLPFSKSYLQRTIAIAALSKKTVELTGYTASNDTDAAIQIIQSLDYNTSIDDNTLKISPPDLMKNNVVLHANESGLSSRLFSIVVALLTENAIIKGEGTLLNRPFFEVENVLQQLGKETLSNKGFLPLQIHGKFTVKNIKVDASQSSQILSGLLITLPFANFDTCEIHVNNCNSKPYIQMTLDILSHFGIEILNDNYNIFTLQGNQQINNQKYSIEGDWSAASIHAVIAAATGKIVLQNANINSAQADKAILNVLQECGAHILIKKDSIEINRNKLNAFQYNATDCPDLFPALAVLASQCKGKSVITGTKRLIHKESNRAQSIEIALKNLGIHVNIEDNCMMIEGGTIKGGTIDSHHDHRIAMMGAALGLLSENGVLIKDSHAVNKSYPDFFKDFFNLQAHE